MRGTIRLGLGFILMLGGEGGMEMSLETFPLDSFLVAMIGLTLMGWGALAANHHSNMNDF